MDVNIASSPMEFPLGLALRHFVVKESDSFG